MKIFTLAKANPNLPKYLQIAEVIRRNIRNQALNAGEALPSAASLGRDLHCNRHTVMKAYGELIAEGYVESIERVGYKVISTLPLDLVFKHASSQATPKTDVHQYRIVRKGSIFSDKNAQSYDFNLAGGQADLALFPFAEFKSYMSESLSRPNINEYGYGDVQGSNTLLAEVAKYLRKSRGIRDREIVITNGSQEAMYISAHLLLKQGDMVAVEALGYPPAFDAFRSTGAELVPIEQDEFGIVPASLEAKIVQGNIRLLYLTPLHQYPTTVTLSPSRRAEVYQLAAIHNIPIIEDDYDHEFHYSCQPLPPIATEDPKQLVIYISTLSKVLFPGARIGFMAVNKAFAKHVAQYRLLINHKNNIVMQSALAKWMQSGGFERHIRRTTRSYEQRRDSASHFLCHQGLFEFALPDGGMALWLKLKSSSTKASELCSEAKRAGIFIQDENSFHVDKSQSSDQHIRVGFAGMNEQRFIAAMGILASLL